MYNIIESKYRGIFLICIIGILLFLFINSGSVVEGMYAAQRAAKAAADAKKAKEKAEKAKADAEKAVADAKAATEKAKADAEKAKATLGTVTPTAIPTAIPTGIPTAIPTGIPTGTTTGIPIGTTTGSSGTTTSTPIGTTTGSSGTTTGSSGTTTGTSGTTTGTTTGSRSGSYTKTSTANIIINEVNARLPSLVSGILKTPVEDIKNAQTEIANELKKLSESQANLNKNIDRVNNDIQNAKTTYIGELQNKNTELSTNLSQQYEMYKTGLLHESTEASGSIKEMVKNVSNDSEKAVVARDKAQEYADLTNKIYNNVFGKLTAQVVQQDNANFSAEAFTPMNGSGYTTKTGPNTKNLFDLEKELVNAINDFNTSYYNFIRCSSGGSINCGNKPSDEELEEKSKGVSDAAERLKSAYEEANIKTNDGTFKSNHQEIMNKSKSIDELRRNLDIKMDTILKSRNPPNELTQQYDSTVYTGIMWSVLATSVLFYIFTEM